MSFHMQRLGNKLFRTKMPASAYDYHYAFIKKRGLKEESSVPSVTVTPLSERNLDEMIHKTTEISNWKLVEHRKQNPVTYTDQYIVICIILMFFTKTANKRIHYDNYAAFNASSISNLGGGYLQDQLT